jgi:Ca2+/Na+ antiporter
MNDRIERLKNDAAELNVGKGAARDGLYQALGAAAMVVGVVVALVAYLASRGLDDTRDIQSTVILALAMLALAVTGAAVFLRYSMARFLRFWLLRQLYEGQSHIDQVVAALGERGTVPGNSDELV